MTEAKDLAKRFRAALEELQLSNAQIAKACGVTLSAVTNWKTDGRIHKKHLATLAQLTGRPLAWWLGDPKVATTAPDAGAPSREERQLLDAWRWLLPEEQASMKADIEARAARNMEAAKVFRLRVSPAPVATDARVAQHIPPAPKPVRAGQKR